MEVEYRPPDIGTTEVPIEITGPGTLDIRRDGLQVVGATVRSSGRARGYVVGVIGLIVVYVLAQHLLGMDGVSPYALAIMAGGLLKRFSPGPAEAGVRTARLFPWKKIKRISYDADAGCVVVVIRGMRPRGGLYILSEEGSNLHISLDSTLERVS
jgi:hypothetical protein